MRALPPSLRLSWMPLLALVACEPEKEPEPSDTKDSPSENTDSGTPSTDDSNTTTEPNEAPSAPVVAITPTVPAPGLAFTVSILTPSVDPEGAEVTYRYAWEVDGAASPIDAATIPGESAIDGQSWTVTVTPNDGVYDGPSASASVIVGNAAPSAPALAFNPVEPIDGEDIELVISPLPVDPDGDPITTTITWYENEVEVPWFADLTVVDGIYVENDDTFRVVVSVTDGFHEPIVTEASVTVEYTCNNLPPFNIGDNTLSNARAYHGLAFDTGGNLIGYDGQNSITKSRYDGTRTVWLPGFGSVEQIDTLVDGDFVMADMSDQRLVRVDSAGGSETLASSVGSVYGVTVGPDGNVWLTNGGVYRVDVNTGEKTTIMESQRGWTAHALNFNLDSTRLYVGSIGGGDLYYIDLDADLNPTTGPTIYASGVGRGYMDGVEVDECGNVYVADYSSRGLYRVELDGTVTSMVATTSNLYGHGVRWGNGVDGWMDDTLYQPQPYNGDTVREVKIGFKSGDTVRTWNGVAVPW